MPSPRGRDVFTAKSLMLPPRSPRLDLRKETLRLCCISSAPQGTWLSSCFLSWQPRGRQGEPHTPPCPRLQAENPGESRGQRGHTAFHPPRPICPSSLSLLVSFLQFPRKVCSTHSLTLTHPKSSTTSLFKNERLQFSRSGRGKAAWEARGRACLPSSHPAAWRPGRAPPRRGAGPARETTAASPQPFFSL